MLDARVIGCRVMPLLIVYFLHSGSVWAGGPTEVARGVAPRHPQQPQVAVDAKGAIHVVFGVGDTVRYIRSDDGGQTFARAVDLPSVHAMSLGMRRGPRIAATESSICVTAIGGKQGKGRDGDVLAMRSVDGGQTWTEAVRVNDAADSAREGLHAMVAGPDGTMCCAWLDLRNRKSEVMASFSADGGRTWSENVLVYRSPDGNVCECCHPSVALGSQGKVHVLFRNSLAGMRDMYVASSSDRGKTFGSATKLGRGSWPLDACPMDGGAIAVAEGGRLSTVWRREKAVFLAAGSANENNLGAGEQPWIAMTSDGPYTVWLKKRGESLLLNVPGSDSPLELSSHAKDPVLAAGPQGRGPVVAAWESRDAAEYTVQVQIVSP